MKLRQLSCIAVCLLQHLLAAASSPELDKHVELVKQVQNVRDRVNKLVELSKLPAGLAKEAQEVKVLADKALSSHGASDAMLADAVRGFEGFRTHLLAMHDSALRGSAPSKEKLARMDEQAKALLPRLEANVKRILSHLSAQSVASTPAGGSDDAERSRITDRLSSALKGVVGEDAPARVLRLHSALAEAQGFLEHMTKKLAEQETHLHEEVEEQEGRMLFTMLKQRTSLPMPTQVALLRRRQFANDTYAQRLLKSHKEDVPLYQQLEAILPTQLAQKLRAKDAGRKDHLAVAGSEGRVHIVSSRLKNTVKGMVAVLRSAKAKLAALCDNPKAAGINDAQATQARHIIKELDEVLANVGKTNDLQKQLDAMDEVESRLKRWMVAAAKAEAPHGSGKQ